MQLLTLSVLHNMRNRYIEISNISLFNHVASYSTLLAMINTVRMSQLILTFWSVGLNREKLEKRFIKGSKVACSGSVCHSTQYNNEWHDRRWGLSQAPKLKKEVRVLSNIGSHCTYLIQKITFHRSQGHNLTGGSIPIRLRQYIYVIWWGKEGWLWGAKTWRSPWFTVGSLRTKTTTDKYLRYGIIW